VLRQGYVCLPFLTMFVFPSSPSRCSFPDLPPLLFSFSFPSFYSRLSYAWISYLSCSFFALSYLLSPAFTLYHFSPSRQRRVFPDQPIPDTIFPCSSPSDRGLCPARIEEFLRFYSPVKTATCRLHPEPTELAAASLYLPYEV